MTGGGDRLVRVSRVMNAILLGSHDETLCGRIHRNDWRSAETALDLIFFIIRGDANHCRVIHEWERTLTVKDPLDDGSDRWFLTVAQARRSWYAANRPCPSCGRTFRPCDKTTAVSIDAAAGRVPSNIEIWHVACRRMASRAKRAR